MNFLERIFAQLENARGRAVLSELHASGPQSTSGSELLAQIAAARAFLRGAGLVRGDRCVLLAQNSVQWVVLDLAILAEGMIAVPLYARQAPAELAMMMRDAGPSLVCCGDAALRDSISAAWPHAPRQVLFGEIVDGAQAASPARAPVAMQPALSSSDVVAILYTSGTSGEAKGVMLTAGNLNHILGCTTARLDVLMGETKRPDRVFHYAPFCFAASWILLLSCLLRESELKLNMDLARLAEDISAAAPDYFTNVPILLERMRTAIEQNIEKLGGAVAKIYSNARHSYLRRESGRPCRFGWLWLFLANVLIFPKIRKRVGPNLRALLCGSAPLARETQLFFLMAGIPVLQIYGLTETTAICTMDDPRHVEPGRVGPAIPGTEMKLGEQDEILVRGPNIFPGYWNRPAQTAQVLRDGWFHTGDQGEVSAAGNWQIIGRLKNLIILSSGHNVAPEPLEDELLRAIPGAQQVILVGNGCGYLSAIVTGNAAQEQIASQIERVNAAQPHYRKIRKFHAEPQPCTIENGLLTANGKLKRDAIAARFAGEIERMYERAAAQHS